MFLIFFKKNITHLAYKYLFGLYNLAVAKIFQKNLDLQNGHNLHSIILTLMIHEKNTFNLKLEGYLFLRGGGG